MPHWVWYALLSVGLLVSLVYGVRQYHRRKMWQRLEPLRKYARGDGARDAAEQVLGSLSERDYPLSPAEIASRGYAVCEAMQDPEVRLGLSRLAREQAQECSEKYPGSPAVLMSPRRSNAVVFLQTLATGKVMFAEDLLIDTFGVAWCCGQLSQHEVWRSMLKAKPDALAEAATAIAKPECLDVETRMSILCREFPKAVPFVVEAARVAAIESDRPSVTERWLAVGASEDGVRRAAELVVKVTRGQTSPAGDDEVYDLVEVVPDDADPSWDEESADPDDDDSRDLDCHEGLLFKLAALPRRFDAVFQKILQESPEFLDALLGWIATGRHDESAVKLALRLVLLLPPHELDALPQRSAALGQLIEESENVELAFKLSSSLARLSPE